MKWTAIKVRQHKHLLESRSQNKTRSGRHVPYQQVARSSPEGTIEGGKTTKSETELLCESNLQQEDATGLKGPTLILQQQYSYRIFTYLLTYLLHGAESFLRS